MGSIYCCLAHQIFPRASSIQAHLLDLETSDLDCQLVLCISPFNILGWLGSRVVSVLDSVTEGPGFKSQLQRCRAVSGKPFTPIVLCSPSSKISSSPLKGCEGNCRPGGKYWQPTAGFMTQVICRLTAKNRDQLRNPMLGYQVWATFTLLPFNRCGQRPHGFTFSICPCILMCVPGMRYSSTSLSLTSSFTTAKRVQPCLYKCSSTLIELWFYDPLDTK